MALQVHTRGMTLADIPAVREIDRLSFPLPWSERTYRFELLENDSAHLLVAEATHLREHQVIGHVGFWIIVDEAHISTLAVHPDFRGNAIGGQLLAQALHHARKLGATLATLEVRNSNLAAICLYKKFGFQVVGRRKRYYRDNHEDALLMTLKPLRQGWSSGNGGAG